MHFLDLDDDVKLIIFLNSNNVFVKTSWSSKNIIWRDCIWWYVHSHTRIVYAPANSRLPLAERPSSRHMDKGPGLGGGFMPFDTSTTTCQRKYICLCVYVHILYVCSIDLKSIYSLCIKLLHFEIGTWEVDSCHSPTEVFWRPLHRRRLWQGWHAQKHKRCQKRPRDTKQT